MEKVYNLGFEQITVWKYALESSDSNFRAFYLGQINFCHIKLNENEKYRINFKWLHTAQINKKLRMFWKFYYVSKRLIKISCENFSVLRLLQTELQ